MATFGQCSEGFDEVTTWVPRVSCIHSSPNFPGHKDRPTAFPPSLVSEVALTPPPVSPHLPMWPPTRPVWPPSRSVFRGRGVGEARLSSGVRSGTGLQGRWGSSDDQHVRSRHGLGCSQCSGQPQIGSCGGRVDPLAGSATRHRHHVGVSFCAGTGPPEPGQPITMERLWKMLDAGKRPLTPNFPVKAGELASWSWQLKLVGGGARRQRNSSPHWRKLAPRRCHRFCKAGLRQHG